MSLRFRLFLLLGGLIAVLLFAQWWMWRTLTGKLDSEMKHMAFSVGQGVVSFFAVDEEDPRFVVDLQGADVEIEHDHDRSWVEKEAVEFRTAWRVISDGQQKTILHKEIKTGHEPTVIKKKYVRGTDSKEMVETIENTLNKAMMEEAIRSGADVHVFVQEDGITGGPPKVIEVPGDELISHKTLVLSVDEDDLVLGEDMAPAKKRIPIPKGGVSESIARAQQQYLLGSAGILLAGLLLAAMAAHRFTTPLRQLAQTAQEVGQGKLGLQVQGETSASEVGVAIGAFNKMSLRLRDLDAQARLVQERAYLSELGEIANGLAHTIRNPLNTLGLSVEQLAMTDASDQHGQELAHTARQQIRRIDQWIRSFLAFASQGVATEEHLDFPKIIQDVVLEAIQDGSKPIDLDMHLPEETPDVSGVEPEMRAVLQALVVNAVEASPEGSTVVISLKTEEHQMQIDVEDQGSGVDGAIRDKLFTPHVTTKPTGSGMGLFLAGRIITSRYQGTVALLDREGGGTTARVTIPLSGDKHG